MYNYSHVSSDLLTEFNCTGFIVLFLYVSMCNYVFVCMYVDMYVCTYVCMYVCVYVNVSINVCTLYFVHWCWIS